MPVMARSLSGDRLAEEALASCGVKLRRSSTSVAVPPVPRWLAVTSLLPGPYQAPGDCGIASMVHPSGQDLAHVGQAHSQELLIGEVVTLVQLS